MACIPSSPVVLVSRGRSNNVMLRQPCLISGDVKCRCSRGRGRHRSSTPVDCRSSAGTVPHARNRLGFLAGVPKLHSVAPEISISRVIG